VGVLAPAVTCVRKNLHVGEYMSTTINVRKLTLDKIESPDGTNSYEPPKGWRQITVDEFTLSHFNNMLPDHIENRQFIWHKTDAPYNKIYIHAQLYWYADNTGIAFHKEWVYNPKIREGKWVMFYFAFGCNHQFKELSQKECRARDIPHYGNCWHVHECQLCKRTNSYDSSD
jgi:hypothetical protein